MIHRHLTVGDSGVMVIAADVVCWFGGLFGLDEYYFDCCGGCDGSAELVC